MKASDVVKPQNEMLFQRRGSGEILFEDLFGGQFFQQVYYLFRLTMQRVQLSLMHTR